jgi:hypothetical protein
MNMGLPELQKMGFFIFVAEIRRAWTEITLGYNFS